MQPLAPDAGAAPSDGAQPEAAGMVVWKDAVGPASARMLGYTDMRVGPGAAASAGLTRFTPGLRSEAEPEQPDVYLSVAALLKNRTALTAWCGP